MGDNLKACPSCAEQIQAAAVICRFCQYDFRSGAVGRPAPPPPSSGGGATKVILIVVAVVLLVPCVLGFLAALLLPAIARATRNAKATACVNNLAQLWKMEHGYRVQFGGTAKAMPHETGGAFWIKLTQTNPPLIDSSLKDIFQCPMKGTPNAAGTTDYRGPASRVETMSDGDAVGADRIGNHGALEGGNVLRKSGDILTVSDSDPLWRSAGSTTIP